MNHPDASVNSSSPQPAAPQTTAANGLNDLLGSAPRRRWWQRTTVWLGVVGLLVAAGGVYAWQASKAAGAAPSFVTEEVRRGNLTLNVAANGTLNPTRTVTIGSELSGTVRSVLVDVNDKVKKGQVLVELDTAKLEAQVLRSRASLASAQAKLAQAQATTKESEAGFARLQEVARLSGGKVPSATELDAGRATLDRAKADELSARASVDDAKAALSTDETSLSKASIRSPINGVVLTRSVEPGNAVAASLQAVTLFTVVEDLTRLRLDVSVDEADVGSLTVGQKASFTVSAYPSRRYPAEVTRVSFGSTKTDNVVTYITWLDVDNSDLSLRPGMTAAATITSTERNDVLLVPNTALRFTPAQAGAESAGKPASSNRGIVSQLMPGPPRNAPSGRKPAGGNSGNGQREGAGQTRQIWLLKDGTPQPMTVKAGISDGRMTEVSAEGLEPGAKVITDQRTGKAAP
ncbi:HlyD family secretion protein [Acidovorax sp. 62]|uniref:efflux RND transporter periplasmic adaptor subunit n=1 Tax=Acidovorax sp. 62 TaxID=2035203 RepID=UPI000C1A7137|nr:efflux RND transporter periplasmic adaptor subunit [Acidovorax sp. 62]PIF90100.1 HlyD family secretion protein [Acidovorax sp. 62]